MEVEEGMTLRDYITRYAKREKDEQIDKLVDHLGVDRSLLEELTVRYINEKSLNAFGTDSTPCVTPSTCHGRNRSSSDA